jgi:predicted secreted protein
MSATRGRAFVVKRNGIAVAGIRTKSISVNGSPIDVTNDDDDGVRKLLEQPGEVTVTITVAGIQFNDVLAAEAVSRTDRIKHTQFLRPGSPDNGFSGDFFMSSYSENTDHKEAALFEATFESAGEVTFA